MANPQREKGHIDIANEIAERFCSYRISGQEWQVIWTILRKTWGWHKKLDIISLSQFKKATTIGQRRCHALLVKLIKKGVIIKSVTQKGDNRIIRYGIQKNYDLWKVSPKKAHVPKKGNGVSPKKATKVSPKKAHTKERKKLYKRKEMEPVKNPAPKINKMGEWMDKNQGMKIYITRFEKESWLKIRTAIGEALKKDKHPEAIKDLIIYIYKHRKRIPDPQTYFWGTLNKISGNYYEQENISKHEKIKSEEIPTIGSIFKKMTTELKGAEK